MYKNATFAAPLRTRDRSYSFANKPRLYLSPTHFKNTSQLLTQQTRDLRYSYSHPPFIDVQPRSSNLTHLSPLTG